MSAAAESAFGGDTDKSITALERAVDIAAHTRSGRH